MISKVCECGIWISGYNDKQLDYLMKRHKEGKFHKKQIKFKKNG